MGDICEKEQKGDIPFLLFATDISYQLKVACRVQIWKKNILSK